MKNKILVLKIAAYSLVSISLFIFALQSIASSDSSITRFSTTRDQPAIEDKVVDKQQSTEQALSPDTTSSLTPKPSTLNPPVPVTSVSDGDTITVEIAGKREKVRMIGVNTPESVDPRKPVQCYGHEASDFTKKNLGRQMVHLETDPAVDDRDKYGRLLRYVYLPDGTLYNQLLIEQGYAYEYTYNVPYQHQSTFKSVQTLAQKEGRGLWNASTCNGKK